MRKHRRISLFLFSIPLLISLACNTTPINKVFGPSDPVNEPPQAKVYASQAVVASAPASQPQNEISTGSQQAPSSGFTKSDCSMAGINFDPINISNDVYDVYNGPSLSCSYSSPNAYGLDETVYLSITAYQSDALVSFYQDVKDNIHGYIAQANEWNAQPDLPADAMNGITMIRDDSDGYVFVITKNAIQGCTKGDGYGVEKVNGKYLVRIVFSSCVSDASGYQASMKYIQSIAESAINRVEAGAQP